MHDPEFEKEVQKKMEELEFTPSEGVWMNLQRGLHKEERRRVPILWLFFLLGGVLLGAGGVSLYYFHRSPSGIAVPGGSGGAGSTETRSATNTPVIVESGSGGNRPVEAGSPGGSLAEGGKMVSIGRITKRDAAAFDERTTNGKITNVKTINGKTANEKIADGNRVNSGSSINSSSSVSGNSGFANGQETSVVHSVAIKSTGLSLHQAASGNIDYRAGDKTNAPHIRGLMTIPTATAMNKRAAKKARFAAGPSWEAGFAGGGGFSSASLPSSGATDQPSGPPTLAYALQTIPASAGHVEMRICKIQPDLSFWAGIFVQRSVMKRLSFTAGLNLHYFSTRLETMEAKNLATSTNVSGAPPPTNSFYGSSPYVQPSVSGSSYYGADYKFNNHYYFLQLPVSLQWQVNRSRKTPIFWEGGLALSRLISANALYYSEKSGLYYKDGGAANPNHLMAFSSLMVGLSLGGNNIKIGPEGQYGLTSLIHAGNVTSQHLFYGGIKITVIPRKW